MPPAWRSTFLRGGGGVEGPGLEQFRAAQFSPQVLVILFGEFIGRELAVGRACGGGEGVRGRHGDGETRGNAEF
jgi:hypothetical protein